MATLQHEPVKEKEEGLNGPTLADLLAQFGPLLVRRIRTDPPPGYATEQDVVDLHDCEKRLYELIDGVLVEKTRGFFESRLAVVLINLLETFAHEHDLGIVAGPDGMLRLAPGLVRIPDVSFVTRARLPGGRVHRESIPGLVPDLAIEVISKGNTAEEMQGKLHDYFRAGVRLVWYVDVENRSVRVYTSAGAPAVIAANQVLDGGGVLPGFSIAVQELFARAEK